MNRIIRTGADQETLVKHNLAVMQTYAGMADWDPVRQKNTLEELELIINRQMYKELLDHLAPALHDAFKLTLVLTASVFEGSYPKYGIEKLRAVMDEISRLQITEIYIGDVEGMMWCGKLGNNATVFMAWRLCIINTILRGDFTQDEILTMAKIYTQTKPPSFCNRYHPELNHFYQIYYFYIPHKQGCFAAFPEANRLEMQLMKEALADDLMRRISSNPLFIGTFFQTVPHHIKSISEISIEYIKKHADNMMIDIIGGYSWSYTLTARNNYSAMFAAFYGSVYHNHTSELDTSWSQVNPDDFTLNNYFEYLKKGYICVHYNKFDVPPEDDLWRVVSYSHHSAHSVVTVEFDTIIDPVLKRCAKNAIWQMIGMAKHRSSSIRIFLDNLKYMDCMKLIPDWSYISDVQMFKAAKHMHGFLKSTKAKEDFFRDFRHMIETSPQINTETGAIRHLIYHNPEYSEPKHRSIAQDKTLEIEKVLEFLRTEAETSVSTMVFYLAIQLTRETELRMASVERLDTTDLVTQNDENYLMTVTKTNSSQKEKIAITRKAAEIIRTAISVTAQYREDESFYKVPEYANRIFLVPGKNRRLSPVCSDTAQKRLSRVNNKLGTHVTPKDFRKNSIAKVVNYSEENGLALSVQAVLTGHTNMDTVRTNYDSQTDIGFLLQVIHKCEVDPKVIKGTVIKKIRQNLPVAENSIGHCREFACSDNGYNPCLLCKHFICDVKDIPAFEAAIADYDRQLEDESLPEHERDFLAAKKRINVSYLVELKKKERSRR